MSNEETKLRGNAAKRSGPYPLAELPDTLAVAIGRQIVHRMAVGQTDITGDDFGEMFAQAISGAHRGKPLGIADVEWNGCAWCVKTVQNPKPFTARQVRLIAGRNAPVYSSGIDNAFTDLQATGRSVLNVWNGRVDEAFASHDDLRIMCLIRNMSALQFTLFEREAKRFVPAEYTWTLNARRNFVGCDSAGRHCFTWQPHGGQFTIHQDVPTSAYRFTLSKRPQIVAVEHVMRLIGWKDDWVIPYVLKS